MRNVVATCLAALMVWVAAVNACADDLKPTSVGVFVSFGPGMRDDARIERFLHVEIPQLFPAGRHTVAFIDSSVVGGSEADLLPPDELCRRGATRNVDCVLQLHFRPTAFHPIDTFWGKSVLVYLQVAARMVVVNNATVTYDSVMQAPGRQDVVGGRISERAALWNGLRNLWTKFAVAFKAG